MSHAGVGQESKLSRESVVMFLLGAGRWYTLNSSVDPLPMKFKCDYNDYMITNLREAKSHLSQLVQLAAHGEEIIITVHGKPMARIVPIMAIPDDLPAKEEWIKELTAAAEKACPGPPRATGQDFWDELRKDRI
jgi:prevent-host-death family protein